MIRCYFLCYFLLSCGVSIDAPEHEKPYINYPSDSCVDKEQEWWVGELIETDYCK